MPEGVTGVPADSFSSRSNARSNKSGPKKRFACLGGALYRHRWGSYNAVFRHGGKLVWKRLKVIERGKARQEMGEAFKGVVADVLSVWPCSSQTTLRQNVFVVIARFRYPSPPNQAVRLGS